FDAAGAARHFRRVGVWLALVSVQEGSSANGHRGLQLLGLAHEYQPAVIGYIKPFMGVGGPGVGSGVAVQQVGALWGGGSPQTKGAVHMYPGAGFVGDSCNLAHRVEGAGVDVTRLATD